MTANSEKEILIDELKKTFSNAVAQHASENDKESQWMLQNCGSAELAKVLPELSGIAIHILAAIGQWQPVNSITISKKTTIPKGTISKVVRKLAAQNLIISIPVPNNKKEVLFHITPLGKELYELHQALHRQMEIGINIFLKRYESQELQFLIRFLKDFEEVSWTDIKEK